MQNNLYADALVRLAELEKSSETIHTYRVTPFSLGNAVAAGLDVPKVVAELEKVLAGPIPEKIASA